MTTSSTLDTARVLRRILLALAAFGVIGTLVELVLTGHYQELAQWPPLILLVLTGLGIIVITTKPTSRTLQFFRWLMVIVTLSSLVGIYFHLHGNMEFRAETNPDLTGFALFWKAIRGGIPLLAPGVMAQVGLLGLAATFRHPALLIQPH
jgi:hypothetical protein